MTSKLFTTVSLAALALAATPALAAGTQQGTSITNNVAVSYQVGGVAQNDVTASDSFVVDRKINLAVSESGGAATSVSPGQTGAVTVFTVTNGSNDTIDLGLSAFQQTGGAARFTGTDNYDVTGLALYRETNGTAGLQTGAGGDTLVTYLDEVAADANITVYAVGNVPLGRASGDVATVTLTATARAGGAAGSEGAVVAETTGANTAGVDTVFADTLATGGNTARDGKALDRDDFRVAAAAISATKNSLIIYDPVNLTANPKMIPGAIVQYCITVSNATGSATATSVTLSDILPGATELFTDSASPYFTGIRVNGSQTGGVCDATSGTVTGSFAPAGPGAPSGTVSGALSDIAAGISRTLLFRVVVK